VNDNPEVRASEMDTPSVDPRTGLAKERTSFAKFRTQLALDRTTLAWIRTALTMATFGFGMVGFFRSLKNDSPTPEVIQVHQDAIRFGVALVALGLAATILAGLSHWRALRRLRHDEAPVLSGWPLSLTVALLLAILGAASLWSLLTR
jgi:putative membrane protein